MPEAVARMCFVKKVFLKFSQKFRGKHLCWSFYFIKMLAGQLKRRLQYNYFPLNFTKFLRKLFLQNSSCGCPNMSLEYESIFLSRNIEQSICSEWELMILLLSYQFRYQSCNNFCFCKTCNVFTFQVISLTCFLLPW